MTELVSTVTTLAVHPTQRAGSGRGDQPTELHTERPAARSFRLLDDLGLRPEVYDITASLGVPTFAFCAGATTVAYASGTTAVAALGEGFQRALLAVQAKAYGQAAYAPEPVAKLPARMQGTDTVAVGVGQLRLEAVAAALGDLGRRAVVVPLDHDRAVCEILPYLAIVVITNE